MYQYIYDRINVYMRVKNLFILPGLYMCIYMRPALG